MRYQTSFSDPNVTCDLIERNPGFIPVIEVGGVWGFGRVVCICDNYQEAELICTLLNRNFAGLSKEWGKA